MRNTSLSTEEWSFIEKFLPKFQWKTLCAVDGDLQKLRGRPGQICAANGRYVNIHAGELKRCSREIDFLKYRSNQNGFTSKTHLNNTVGQL